jgi:hypothetical protein
VATALGGIGLLFESSGRQAEFAIFGVYKNMEILYNMAMRRKMPIAMASAYGRQSSTPKRKRS